MRSLIKQVEDFEEKSKKFRRKGLPLKLLITRRRRQTSVLVLRYGFYE